ncbi:MAG: hypothetical protein ACKOQM_13205 [Novosphingobium sp.]
MSQSLYAVLPIVAILLFIGVTLILLARPTSGQGGGWLFPTTFSAAFLGWSLYTVGREGPLGFWPNHTANAWGNQVWFDLLLAIGTAWALLLPRARAVGMRPLPWLVLIACSGSIGLLAMVARCLILESKRTQS